MALLPYRYESVNGATQSVDNFMNTTGEAGYLVVYQTSTSGLGSSFDDAGAIVKLPVAAGGSGEKPAGVLLGNVVNKDLAHTHLNTYKREWQVGGKVTLLKRGTIVTNALSGNTTNPAPGDPAYFTAGGVFTTTAFTPATGDNSPSTRIGTFTSSKTTDGFVKIDLNIV